MLVHLMMPGEAPWRREAKRRGIISCLWTLVPSSTVLEMLPTWSQADGRTCAWSEMPTVAMSPSILAYSWDSRYLAEESAASGTRSSARETLATLGLHGMLESRTVGTGQFTGGIGPQEDALGLLSHLLLRDERGWSESQSPCCLEGALSEGHAALQELPDRR